MKVTAMIPSRMGSWRFPGKPLCDICGLPMIEHVYKRTAMSKVLHETYMVTCNKEIEEATKKFGGKVIMTPDTFNRCTDRIAYAAEKSGCDADIIVVVQGDEPLVYPEMIDQAVKPMLEDPSIVCGCLISKTESAEEFDDRNVIKVVKDNNDFALYLSREGIPSKRLYNKPFDAYKQVCIMPYRRDFLLKFTKLPQTPLETVESVDMLRILEHGYKIKLVETHFKSHSVDVEADRHTVIKLMEKDELFPKYGKVKK